MKIFQITPNYTKMPVKDKSLGAQTYYNPNFKGLSLKKPESKIFKPVREFFRPLTKKCIVAKNKLYKSIAKGIVKVLQFEPVKDLVEKVKDCKNLYPHLTTLTSIVLSGFYIQQTLKNDKLDPARKRTLAINQGIVQLLSTVMAYTVDKFTEKKINEFTNKFMAANYKDSTSKLLGKYGEGIKAAKSLMIFGVMYRYITPVLVTPIANHIGNKVNEKNK